MNITPFSKAHLRKNSKTNSIDPLFLTLVVAISIFGTIMVFSAGGAYALARYNDSFYFIKRQSLWLMLGFAVMYISSKIKPSIYKKYAPHLYALTVFLLLLVLIVGFVGNGAKRWISIGPLTLQPSEIAKFSLLLILARYFDDNDNKATDYNNKRNSLIFGTLIPFAIMALPIVLVMLQKHLSCIVILGSIGLLFIFIAGVDPKYISIFCAIGIITVLCIAFFTDYTKERIVVWQNPEAYKLTGGWQTLQGLMAIGSGGIWGVGIGNSVLKHCYVSEPANDMIFAILCEETGLAGAILTIALFGALILRGTQIAAKGETRFSQLLCYGLCIKTALQVLLNIAVVTNTLPNTGISLPFFSYGGSSLVMLFFEMGIILSISRKSKIIK